MIWTLWFGLVLWTVLFLVKLPIILFTRLGIQSVGVSRFERHLSLLLGLFSLGICFMGRSLHMLHYVPVVLFILHVVGFVMQWRKLFLISSYSVLLFVGCGKWRPMHLNVILG